MEKFGKGVMFGGALMLGGAAGLQLGASVTRESAQRAVESNTLHSDVEVFGEGVSDALSEAAAVFGVAGAVAVLTGLLMYNVGKNSLPSYTRDREGVKLSDRIR